MSAISSVTDSPRPGQADQLVTLKAIAAVVGKHEGKLPHNSE
jgi:hypothetical protein